MTDFARNCFGRRGERNIWMNHEKRNLVIVISKESNGKIKSFSLHYFGFDFDSKIMKHTSFLCFQCNMSASHCQIYTAISSSTAAASPPWCQTNEAQSTESKAFEGAGSWVWVESVSPLQLELYEDQLIIETFYIRAWIVVSQD